MVTSIFKRLRFSFRDADFPTTEERSLNPTALPTIDNQLELLRIQYR